jgi:hypothetical protein
MPDELEQRRRLLALGQRAVDYYKDTGLCVFCECDDTLAVPHDPDCDVGTASGIIWTPERANEKLKQRRIADEYIRSALKPKT